MNTKKLLLQLLPGFIPLIVFILVDEIWGTRIGLLVAIGFGIGGHISYGEDVETSLKREAEEEIGIKDFKAGLVSRYIWESDVEREYVFCFVTRYNGNMKLNSTELADGRFWSRSEIKSNLGKDVFTPNFEEEYRNVLRGE